MEERNEPGERQQLDDAAARMCATGGAAIDAKEVTCPAAIQRTCPTLAAIRCMTSVKERPAA